MIGWFAKALLLRDTYLCVFLSILFEIWELSLQHQLPNFAECWWDHVCPFLCLLQCLTHTPIYSRLSLTSLCAIILASFVGC